MAPAIHLWAPCAFVGSMIHAIVAYEEYEANAKIGISLANDTIPGPWIVMPQPIGAGGLQSSIFLP